MFATIRRVWSRLAERAAHRRAQALRKAIADLPEVTRRAMLEAAESDELIVGAYTDRTGRICPMLAAHRRGARTHVGSFPRAWDAFAQSPRPRAATVREVEILKALLEESLGGAPGVASPSPRQPSPTAALRPLERRMAVAIAFGWLLALAIGPLALWHDVLGSILASFTWSPTYLMGELGPWLLLATGVAFLVPVALSAGRSPESRLYPRGRRVYIAWGSVVYLLGLILAVEVAEVWHYAH